PSSTATSLVVPRIRRCCLRQSSRSTNWPGVVSQCRTAIERSFVSTRLPIRDPIRRWSTNIWRLWERGPTRSKGQRSKGKGQGSKVRSRLTYTLLKRSSLGRFTWIVARDVNSTLGGGTASMELLRRTFIANGSIDDFKHAGLVA